MLAATCFCFNCRIVRNILLNYFSQCTYIKILGNPDNRSYGKFLKTDFQTVRIILALILCLHLTFARNEMEEARNLYLNVSVFKDPDSGTTRCNRDAHYRCWSQKCRWPQ